MQKLKLDNFLEDAVKVHTVPADTTLKSVLQLLYRFNIRSLPVVSPTISQVYLGWIDTLSILDFLVKIVTEPKQSGVTPVSESLTTDDMELLLERSNEWNIAKVTDILGVSRHPISKVSSMDSIGTVLKQLGNDRTGRVLVVDDDDNDKVVGVLTQSAIANILKEQGEELLGDKRKQSVKDLGVIHPNVVSVTEDSKAIDAFITMKKNNLNNVAVVNERGALHGCISATDLKFITDFNFKWLLLSVKDFVKTIRSKEAKTPAYLVYAHEESTLEEVIQKLHDQRVHRVFIVSKEGMKPLGVVSISDICKSLSS